MLDIFPWVYPSTKFGQIASIKRRVLLPVLNRKQGIGKLAIDGERCALGLDNIDPI